MGNGIDNRAHQNHMAHKINKSRNGLPEMMWLQNQYPGFAGDRH